MGRHLQSIAAGRRITLFPASAAIAAATGPGGGDGRQPHRRPDVAVPTTPPGLPGSAAARAGAPSQPPARWSAYRFLLRFLGGPARPGRVAVIGLLGPSEPSCSGIVQDHPGFFAIMLLLLSVSAPSPTSSMLPGPLKTCVALSTGATEIQLFRLSGSRSKKNL